MDDIFENLATAATHSARRGNNDIAELIETAMEDLRHHEPLVTVLTIEHKYGTDVSVHKTQDGAEKNLLEYLKDNWPDDKDVKPMPEGLWDAVQYYFETWHEWEESYHITAVRLLN